MKTFVFKLYNSKRNKVLHQTVNISGIIYNYCIAAHRRYYRLFKKTLSAYRLKTHITKVKRQKGKEYWNEVGSQAIQDIVERIDRAYKLFFGNIKRKVRTSPPGFRKVRRYASFTLKQAGYSFSQDNRVRIGTKTFKYSKSREIEGKIKTVTIKRNPLGNFYLYVVTDLEETKEITTRTGNSAGCDFGLLTYLTLHDGKETRKIQSPLFYKTSVEKVRRAGRRLSRKVKGSNNRKKAVKALYRQHEKIANRRKDHQFKLALDLCRQYDILTFEDLNLRGMQMMWGRKISDLGFSGFLRTLEHQARKLGTKIVYADRFYPSSKTCHNCGHVLETLGMNERTWKCPACGADHDRDENAAINLHRVGASTLGGETVKLGYAS